MNIFVFGSNLAGIHGAGAAKAARELHGAILGQGIGFQGQSYAIPTKASPSVTLSLSVIEEHVKNFLVFATQHPTWTFQVTRIGCGLAGYQTSNIAPMFRQAPTNCVLPEDFISYLKAHP